MKLSNSFNEVSDKNKGGECGIITNNIEQNEEHQREAICNTCDAIWHPRKTDTRRPTRCPYCQSRRTEWLDQHMESNVDMVESKQSNEDVETETEDMELNSSFSATEASMDYTMENHDDTSEDIDSIKAEETLPKSGNNRDYSMAYARNNPWINPPYSKDFLTKKKKSADISKAVVFVLLGAGLLFLVFRIWNLWKKPIPPKSIVVSKPTADGIDTPRIGLTDMGLQRVRFI